MEENDKKLLAAELCARLPYGIKVTLGKHTWVVENVSFEKEGVYVWIEGGNFPIHNAKPYLRPMSSMTEEEIYEYNKLVELDRSNKELFNNLRIEYIQNHPEYKNMPCVPMYRHIDYLNTHHFDYRGLIPMGLALPATEGMY